VSSSSATDYIEKTITDPLISTEYKIERETGKYLLTRMIRTGNYRNPIATVFFQKSYMQTYCWYRDYK